MNSHYVPYWYLRKFANRAYTKDEINDRLVKSNVYNKKSKVSQKELLHDIASEDSYYAEHIEKLLKFTEDRPQKIYKNIIDNENLNLLKGRTQEKEILALTIVSLWMRTKNFRENLLEKNVIPDWKDRDYSFAETAKEVQENTCLHPNMLGIYINALLSQKWTLIINHTKNKFWTSDSPVSFEPPELGAKHELAQNCYFPLSPNLLLWITGDTCVKDCFTTDEYVSEEFVNERNMITYLTAHEYVISSKTIKHSRIKEIELFVKENPPIVAEEE